MPPPHDNYYETAVESIRLAMNIMSPSGAPVNDPQWFVAQGLIRLAQGLQQHQRETELKIDQRRGMLGLQR